MKRRIFDYLHRNVWRRLPVRARRAAFARISIWRAPAITADAVAAEPVIVVGMFKQTSGLGDSARRCYETLSRAGVRCMGVDVTEVLMHPNNHPFGFADVEKAQGPGTILLHVSGPVIPRVMTHLGRDLVRGKRVIAHMFWELPVLPKDWNAAFDMVHEVCVSTSFVRDAIRRSEPEKAIHVVRYPLLREREENATRPAGRPFTVITAFNFASNFARKNPCAVIAAFRLAFGDDPEARLIVKYMSAEAWPKGLGLMQEAAQGASNIEFVGTILDAQGMNALYQQADALVSLHRAEGLGLTIAEAMLRGIPVVATGWSGNVDFFSADCGLPVRYTLVPVNDPQNNYNVGTDSDGAAVLWAEPDVADAAQALRRLRDEPEMAAALAGEARRRAKAFFDPQAYAARMRDILHLKPDADETGPSAPAGQSPAH